MSSVKIFTNPPSRLAALVARSGGISRSNAIDNAKACLEPMRDAANEELLRGIAAIAAVVHGAENGKLGEDAMEQILRLADPIVTMTGTFGYDALDTAVKSLCDVTTGLLRIGLTDAAPIAVHLQSMQLLAPGNAALTANEADAVLSELSKILTHYKFGSLSSFDKPDAEDALHA